MLSIVKYALLLSVPTTLQDRGTIQADSGFRKVQI